MNKNLFKATLNLHGISMKQLKEKMNFSQTTMYSRLHQPEGWRLDELRRLSSIIGVDNVVNIFFTDKVS